MDFTPFNQMVIGKKARISGFHELPGVSIKIEVASGLDRVTDCINKGPLVPFFLGGGGREPRCVLPQKILKFQSPKNAIFSVLGTKVEDKRGCFSFKKM